jgi:hypothetical protein
MNSLISLRKQVVDDMGQLPTPSVYPCCDAPVHTDYEKLKQLATVVTDAIQRAEDSIDELPWGHKDSADEFTDEQHQFVWGARAHQDYLRPVLREINRSLKLIGLSLHSIYDTPESISVWIGDLMDEDTYGEDAAA